MSTDLSDADVEALRRRASTGRRPEPDRLFARAADVSRRHRRRRRAAAVAVAAVVVVAAVVIPILALRRDDRPSVLTLDLPPAPASTAGPTTRVPTSSDRLPTPLTAVPFDRATVVRTGGIMVADGGDLVVLDPDAATRTVVQPGMIGSWSPDRQELVAGTSSPTSDDGLSVLALDGSNRRQVHPPIPRPSDPAWSPDGRQVVFTVPADNPDTILVVNRDGTGLRQVGRGRYPAWSADGRSIFANTLDDAVQIQRIDVDRGTTAIVPLGPGQHSYPGAGNASLAYADANTDEIWIAGLDGSNPRPISRCAAPACNGDITPRWSPDGSRLAFVRTTDGGRTAELVVVSAVTGAEVARFAAADPQRLFLESWR